MFQAATKVRPVKKDAITKHQVEATTKAGENDASKPLEDSDNTKPNSETLIKQEIEESKGDDEAAAASTAESRPENVVEQIRRSTKKKGRKEKRQSSGKKVDNQSSGAEVPDIGKLQIKTEEQK